MPDAIQEFDARVDEYREHAYTVDVEASIVLFRDDLERSAKRRASYLAALADGKDLNYVLASVGWKPAEVEPSRGLTDQPEALASAEVEGDPLAPIMAAAKEIAVELAKLRPDLPPEHAAMVIAMFPPTQASPQRIAQAIDDALDRVEFIFDADFQPEGRSRTAPLIRLFQDLEDVLTDPVEARRAKAHVAQVVEETGAWLVCRHPHCDDLVLPVSDRGRFHRGVRYCRSHSRHSAANARRAS